MKILVLYIGVCALGIWVGTKMRNENKEFKASGKIQTALLVLLLVTMGTKLGANEEVFKNLGSIGLSAFVLTVFIMAGALGAVFLARKLMGFNREGEYGRKEESHND